MKIKSYFTNKSCLSLVGLALLGALQFGGQSARATVGQPCCLNFPPFNFVRATTDPYATNVTLSLQPGSSTAPIPLTTSVMYCVDLSGEQVVQGHTEFIAPIFGAATYGNVKLISTCDPNLASYALPPGWANPSAPHAVNYILNHKQGTYDDVQDAIWYFVGGPPLANPLSAASLAMVQGATNNPNFQPNCGDKIGVILLIPDQVVTNAPSPYDHYHTTPGHIQTVIIETPCCAISFTQCPPSRALGCNPSSIPSCDLTQVAAISCCGRPVNLSCSSDDSHDGCFYSRKLTYVASDAFGNSATCVQTLTWTVDKTAPVLTVPTGSDLGCNSPGKSDADIAALVIVSDTCGGPVTTNVTHQDINQGCTTIRTFTVVATDGCLNSATQTVVFSWTSDSNPPVITVPRGKEFGCAAETPPDDLAMADLVTVSDTCSAVTTNISHVDKSTDCLVIRTFTILASDACSNSATQTVVYSWSIDKTAPTLTVPPGGNLKCNSTLVPTSADIAAQVQANDSCSAVTTNITYQDSVAGCLATRTFTVIASDFCQNSATQTVVFNWITDAGAPSISVPPGTDLGCNPKVIPDDASLKATVRANDTCSTPTVYVTHVDGGTECAKTRTFTVWAVDGCNHTSTAPAVVYSWKADSNPPVLTCPADTNVTCNSTSKCIFGATQGGWGAPPNGNNVGALLANYFSAVYPTGVEVGIPGSAGFSMIFDSALGIQNYLPAGGTAGALNADLLDPTSTSAGVFGGQVLALQLNVDFGDKGVTLTPGSKPIGDLVVTDPNPGLNGKTVRQILALANIALGGGNAGVSIACLNTVVCALNEAFDNCTVSCWAAHSVSKGSNTNGGTGGSTDPSATGTPTATDGCGGNVLITYTDTTAMDSNGNTIITRTWQAADTCGNSVTCPQKITVLNCQPPCTSSICGNVWRDCDGDGRKDSGNTEPGLQSVLVTLKDSKGNVIGTVQTDASGAYCFNNLTGGVYCVLLTAPAGFLQTVDADGCLDNKTIVTILNCKSISNLNFAYTGLKPGITLTKTADKSTAKCGETITYTYVVTDTGNTCFYGGVTVCDPMFGGEIFHQTPVAPGQILTFNKQYVVKSTDVSPLVNTATATGHVPSVPGLHDVSVNATATVTLLPCITGGGTPPCGLSICVACGSLKLSWTSLTGATSYTVKRAFSSGGPCTTIKTGLTQTYFTDNDVTNGLPYFYVVSAIKNGSETANSSEVSGVPSCVSTPWACGDIGSVGHYGGSGCKNGRYTICGSGHDIWGTKDEFQCTSQGASGDCTIVCRVTSVCNTDPWAKAGIMIRECNTTDSKHASVYCTPGNGVAFQYRSNTGGSSSNVNNSGLTCPYWLKLKRQGDTFTAWCSPDGYNWTKLGSTQIFMARNISVCLAVTSHNDNKLCTATFDNVTVTP